MLQNYQTVVTMTQSRTDAQTLAAVHDDRTSQAYSILNGLGPLTSFYMTGAGASASGNAPQSLTPTSYAPATLSDFANNINYLNNASAGTTKFGNGTATPLASAVNFIDNIARANGSTEPTKRTFSRYQGPNPAIDPLDARFNNYNAVTNRGGLSTADTANIVVPGYYSSFTLPAPYANTTEWARGFTVTQARIDANGGNRITAPNIGSFDSAGNFTPATFGVGDFVPGIGAAPRPYRVRGDVNTPTLLRQVINSTNPYGDGSMPSGHTNSAYMQSLATAFLVPQRGQQLFTRASELGNDRILSGMHSPLDVMGGRMQATAVVATNIYNALYDANGNRVDWTNPANANANAVFKAVNETQAYLAQACGAASVGACLQAAGTSGDSFANAAQNKADYTARLTYGFQPIGPVRAMTDAEVPVQAQVLLLTRFPYLTDAQRTSVLASTGLPSGYPLLSGNSWDGWGRINLYSAYDGFGSLNGQTVVTMDASQGGFNAADTWANDIGGSGGLTKAGTGSLTLTGANSYTGPTIVNGGTLVVNGSLASTVTVNASGLLKGRGTVGGLTVGNGGAVAPGNSIGTMVVSGNVTFLTGSTYQVEANAAGQSDQIIASGSATIQGGTVQALADSGVYAARTRYRVLTANGGVSGRFSGVTSNLAFLTPALSYDATGVNLTLARNDVSFASVAGTPNGVAVANAAQSLPIGDTVGDAVGSLSAAGARTAFNALSGEIHADIAAAGFTTATLTRDAVLERAQAIATQKPDEKERATFWTRALGSFGSGGATGNAGHLSRDSSGLMLGGDLPVASGIRVGAAGGYTSSRLGLDERQSSGTVRSGFATVYAVGSVDALQLRGGASYAWNENRVQRTVAFPGFAEAERANYDGSTLQGFGEVGYRLPVGGVQLEPVVGGSLVRVSTRSFTENGGAARLSGDSRDYDLGTSTIGLRGSAALADLGVDLPLSVRAMAGWTHTYGDVTPEARLSFVSGGNAFQVSGTPIARDQAVTSLGVSYAIGDVTATAGYGGTFGGHNRDQQVKGELTLRF
ncbi:autotransporter domain-containing protein [Azospirillum sp. B510]|uniref:autotransporter family protein n=1 Tax=Azospirillum sp. (strain B510) TaxID=137722 RepID=UPI0013051D0B|nr:autotransporter domain-containing protein [Azospirillum sp. B510]